MAIGDNYRRIAPDDQLIFNSAGGVAGIRSGRSTGAEGRMLPAATADAVQALVLEYLNGTLGGSVLTITAAGGTDTGDVLTAALSAGWTVTGYQWTRDGVDISGATASTYTIQSGDAGKTIGCRAAGAVYTGTLAIPIPATPAGALTLDASPITLDALSITLV